MEKVSLQRGKCCAAHVQLARGTVKRVAQHRMAQRGKVHANLVRPAGMQLHFQQAGGTNAREDPPIRASGAGIRQKCRASRCHPGAPVRVARDGQFDSSRLFFDLSLDQCDIDFLDGSLPEGLRQLCVRVIISCYQQDTGSFLVKTVDNSRPQRIVRFRERLAAAEQRVYKRPGVIPCPGMNRHSCGLVHRDHIVIFVKNVQWNRFGFRAHRRPLARLHPDRISRANSLRTLGRLAVQQDQLFVDQFLHSRPRQFRATLRHEPIKPCSGLFAGHREFLNQRFGMSTHAQIVTAFRTSTGRFCVARLGTAGLRLERAHRSPEWRWKWARECTYNRAAPVISERYPWRIVVFAAICILGDVFLGYYMFFGVGADGVGLEDKAGSVVITDVDPGTPGARAGLQAGDQILSVEGQSIGTEIDWLAQRMNFVANRPTTILVRRKGQTIERIMVPRGTRWEDFDQAERAAGIIFLASKLITLAIGLFVVFSRPRDFVSRVGGWVLVVMATVFEAFQWGLSASVRALPFVLAVPVMLLYVSAAFRTPVLAAFFCMFPKRLFTSRWLWAVFWAGPVAATLYALYLFGRTIYDPGHLSGLAPKWVVLGFGVQSIVYLVVVIVILPVSYWRLETPTDRRRFRVLVFGALTSMLFYLPRVIGTALLNVSPGFYAFFGLPAVNLIYTAGMLILPFSFAYAILTQRLFGVRVMLRRGLQYALARRVLLAIPVVAFGLLIVDVLAQGRQPLFSVLKTHAGTYVAVAALAALASTQRQKWLSALDRRFFRDKYDAQQLFHEIVEEIRRAETIEEVAPSVVARVAEGLHTNGCGLLVRKPGEAFYRVVAAAPAGSLNTDLPATNKLIPLVRMLECSVPITQAGSGWLGQQLPTVDKEFLHKARIELLVPVALKEGGNEALLVLSGKLSEEPYSKEDIALLENVASALALLLMRGSVIQPGRAFEECPVCGTCYDTGTTRCAKEGMALTLVASPRLMGSRYRLDGRLGQGGMGKVYRATDVSLNREVAVKMIRDEFFADGKAIEKFRQESQLTGRLAHPNVVTVFDFGVEGAHRVFLVMELLEGITLRQELRAKRRLDPHRTLELFEGICAGVGVAHARGLIHRDLKPENVFLSRKDALELVKITDFGIAKTLPISADDTRDTITGAQVGTIRYMSPEQLRGRSISPRWDLWALTVMAYEALCGAAPFAGDDMSLLQSAIMGVNFAPVHDRLPDAPTSWQKFFEAAFNHQENTRPGTVAEFWQGLQDCLRAPPGTARTE